MKTKHKSATAAPRSNPAKSRRRLVISAVKAKNRPRGDNLAGVQPRGQALTGLQRLAITLQQLINTNNIGGKLSGEGRPSDIPMKEFRRTVHGVLIVNDPSVKEFMDLEGETMQRAARSEIVILNGVVIKHRNGSVGWRVSK
jgi:hypothetical protein